MKIVTYTIGVLLGVALVLALFRQPLMIRGMTWALQRSSGATVEVGAAAVDPWRGRMTLRDVRLINPPAWPSPADVRVREIRMQYDWRSLRSDVIRFSEVVIDVERMDVRVDSQTLYDLQRRAVRRPSRPTVTPAPAPQPSSTEGAADSRAAPGRADAWPLTGARRQGRSSPQSAQRSIVIDSLTLRLGQLMVEEAFLHEWEPIVVPYTLNWEATFSQVDDLDRLLLRLTRELSALF